MGGWWVRGGGRGYLKNKLFRKDALLFDTIVVGGLDCVA
jgi:hypothetical protein